MAAWRARAARMYPSDFAGCPEPVRYALLAALCWTFIGRSRNQAAADGCAEPAPDHHRVAYDSALAAAGAVLTSSGMVHGSRNPGVHRRAHPPGAGLLLSRTRLSSGWARCSRPVSRKPCAKT